MYLAKSKHKAYRFYHNLDEKEVYEDNEKKEISI